MLWPHAQTVPSLLSATACSRPPSIWVTLDRPATVTGVLLLPPAPFPSWPNSSEPNDETEPVVAADAAPAQASTATAANSVQTPRMGRRPTRPGYGAARAVSRDLEAEVDERAGVPDREHRGCQRTAEGEAVDRPRAQFDLPRVRREAHEREERRDPERQRQADQRLDRRGAVQPVQPGHR